MVNTPRCHKKIEQLVNELLGRRRGKKTSVNKDRVSIRIYIYEKIRWHLGIMSDAQAKPS